MIKKKKKKKTVNDYAQLLTKIRNEYVLLQKENNQLKIELEKMKNYVENLPKFPRKPNFRQPIWNTYKKRKQFYYDDYEDSEESNSYVTEGRRHPKRRKKVIYEDEIDGIPEYEPHSPTETEEQEEEQNYKIKRRPPPSKQIHKPKQIKKGITKSMKIQFFIFIISCNWIL